MTDTIVQSHRDVTVDKLARIGDSVLLGAELPRALLERADRLDTLDACRERLREAQGRLSVALDGSHPDLDAGLSAAEAVVAGQVLVGVAEQSVPAPPDAREAFQRAMSKLGQAAADFGSVEPIGYLEDLKRFRGLPMSVQSAESTRPPGCLPGCREAEVAAERARSAVDGWLRGRDALLGDMGARGVDPLDCLCAATGLLDQAVGVAAAVVAANRVIVGANEARLVAGLGWVAPKW